MAFSTGWVDGSWVQSGWAVLAWAGDDRTSTAVVDSGISFYEDEIVAGGKTIVLRLIGDTWVASGATFDAQRQNIINGLDAATSPAGGWNLQVRDVIGVGTVVRTSDTLVTITLPATAGYTVASDETITVTIPATAVTSGIGSEATPTIKITEGAAPAGTFANKKKVIASQC